ncbi:carbohydrate binding domain-containing protein [Priestia sp. YIM B13551]|uniref:carbohydrate binding domain-containing protein n=1 Tax=Priestia sp. YIM B13551 TaxID=3366306 RepID=UPI00366E3ABB
MILTGKSAKKMPRKNLINATIDNFEQGGIDGNGNWDTQTIRNRYKYFIPVKPNKTYSFSVSGLSDYYWAFAEFNAEVKQGGQTYNSGWIDGATTPTKIKAMTSTSRFIGVAVRKRDNTSFVPNDLPSDFTIQIEEGSTVTEFEPYMEVSRGATKESVNMLPPLTSERWVVASGQIKGQVKSDYEYYMSIATNNVIGYDFPMTLIKGQTYTLSGTLTGINARIRVIRKDNPSSFLANVVDNNPVTFVASTSDVIVRIENNGKSGDYTVKDFSLVRGNPIPFQTYKEMNRQATLIPKKNLIPTTEDIWYNGTINGQNGAFSNSTSRLVLKANCKIPVKPNTTYTISTTGVAADVTIREMYYFDKSDVYISPITGSANVYTKRATFTTPSNVGYFTFQFVPTGDARKISPSEIVPFVQLEEGSVETAFERYTPVAKKPVSSTAKAPYLNLPITFRRDSVEILNNLQYGINNPRTKNGALLMEEGTTNLIPKLYTSYPTVTGSIVTETDGNYHKMILSNGTDRDHLNVPIKTVKPSTKYTLRFRVRVLEGQDIRIKPYITYGTNSTILDDTPFTTVGREWTEITKTVTMGASTTQANRYCVFFNEPTGQIIEVKDWQFEEKPYATSCTVGDRKAEYAFVPNADKYINATKGSIEYTVTPLLDSDIFPPAGNYGWNDIVYYDEISNGFLIRRNNDAIGGHSVWVQGVEKTYVLDYKAGDKIKYKFEWDSSGSRLYANDVVIYSTASKFVTPNAADSRKLYIGSRSIATRKQGNALYKDLVIKDQYGNVAFQL